MNKIYEEMKKHSERNHSDYVKAILRIELGDWEEDVIDYIYEKYMDRDNISLISDDVMDLLEEYSKIDDSKSLGQVAPEL